MLEYKKENIKNMNMMYTVCKMFLDKRLNIRGCWSALLVDKALKNCLRGNARVHVTGVVNLCMWCEREEKKAICYGKAESYFILNPGNLLYVVRERWEHERSIMGRQRIFKWLTGNSRTGKS